VVFHLDDLLAERAASGRLYHEFLRRDSLSVGLYVLPAGGADPQRPHDQDEVYYVLSGRARFRVGERDRPVGPGAVLFVEAGLAHRFEAIEEELRLLVFFAPAETA
jgi:quercetin dioxygenase-like cupin family protein